MSGRALALLVLLSSMAGCGPKVWYVYEKPGATPAERQRDEAECTRQATVTVSGGLAGGYYRGGSLGRPSQMVDEALFTTCMANRGYQAQKTKE